MIEKIRYTINKKDIKKTMIEVKLKETRQSKGLSQNQLAETIGHTLHSVKRMEHGRFKSIPIETLDKLCKSLDCSVSDILVYIPD
jgi:putative transcriptional regulator